MLEMRATFVLLSPFFTPAAFLESRPPGSEAIDRLSFFPSIAEVFAFHFWPYLFHFPSLAYSRSLPLVQAFVLSFQTNQGEQMLCVLKLWGSMNLKLSKVGGALSGCIIILLVPRDPLCPSRVKWESHIWWSCRSSSRQCHGVPLLSLSIVPSL